MVSFYGEMCRAAGGNGHLEILQWLRAQDPPCGWDSNTTYAVAANGHLAVLKWALGAGCPLLDDADPHDYDFRTTSGALRGGHLHILQWLVETYNVQFDAAHWHDAVQTGK